jgi:hypothetical protein
VLWLLGRLPTLALAISVAIYAVSLYFDWNFPAYPSGHWYFNPLAWQLLFVAGAWCALVGGAWWERALHSRITLAVALLYLLFAFAVTLTWHIPGFGRFMPKLLSDWIYPIDKTNLDMLRFLHFGALAVLTVQMIGRDWPGLKSQLLRPAILCGQHSLEIFCLGVFLAFTGHIVLVEVSDRVSMQVAISALGIALMVATAALLTWYKVVEGRRPGPRPPKMDLAGGEA